MKECTGFVSDTGVVCSFCGQKLILCDAESEEGVVFIPSHVTYHGKSYDITGIHVDAFPNIWIQNFDDIQFETTSKIELIRSSLIAKFSHFNLPPRIKRIIFDKAHESKNAIEIPKGCKFIANESNSLIHIHPFELSIIKTRRSLLFIRETTRFVGKFAAHGDLSLKSIKFPSSLESIGAFSFSNCKNLEFVRFSPDSKLKTIGTNAFSSTAIRSIKIPPSVEKICSLAFYMCNRLVKVIFQRNSSLLEIGNMAFVSTSIKKIEIPSSVVEIGRSAFASCKCLEFVTLEEGSRLNEEKINENGERIIICSELGLRSSLFNGCNNLKTRFSQ